MVRSRSGTIATAMVAVLCLAALGCTPPGASSSVSSLGVRSSHTCAVMTDGRVTCWGLNADGQVGNGVFTGSVAIPLTVLGVSGATQVVGGQQHTCALVAGGSVKCWGDNGLGQLGDGSNVDSAIPVNVTGVSGAVQLDATRYATCALRSDGTLGCWGFGRQGQLGDGTTGDVNPVAVPVSGLSGVADVSVGGGHACARLDDGTVRCWGANSSGTLGDGTTVDRSTPVAVIGLTGVRQVLASGYTSCAVLADRSAVCWGRNDLGGLGTGFGSSTTAPGSPLLF